MAKNKGDELYISHILEAVKKIAKFIANSDFDDFKQNELAQSAVIRELGVIGEAAKELSEDFKKKHADIPWKKIVGMRDKLIHDYFEIDVEAVWKTTKEDLPDLKQKLSK